MFYFIIWSLLTLGVSSSLGTDFYELLGVNRDADTKEIRRAFKKLAVSVHPDKNPNDESAQSNFIKLTKAYETLKNDDTRKYYDLHGDEGVKVNTKQRYQSYTYYRDHFGLYDEDPLITTFNSFDFDIGIGGSAWFINFYSPACGHCHTLAPIWRKLSQELEGVVRIGAINCEEDYQLCRRLKVYSYPTLMYFAEGDTTPEKYHADHILNNLLDFALERIKANVHRITLTNWSALRAQDKNWLLFICTPENMHNCLEKRSRIKVAESLSGLVSVGLVEDKQLANILSNERGIAVMLMNEHSVMITSKTSSGIVKEILSLLPDVNQITLEQFQDIRTRLRLGAEKPWLLCFFMGSADELDLHLKRLPAMIGDSNIGAVNCGRYSNLCSSLHINRYPSWAALKTSGTFEIYHGQNAIWNIVKFAKDSFDASNMQSLSPADFSSILKSGTPWLVEWFAPWCPSCTKLMPELRKASTYFTPEKIQFGTVDCTSHSSLCAQQNIRSYPTIMLYNGTKSEVYEGDRRAGSIQEFVEIYLNQYVIFLSEQGFRNSLMNKNPNDMWLVAYSVSWCQPCQELQSQWRKLAKNLEHFEHVYVASIDCVLEADLCRGEGIRSYPTIRLYPTGSEGLNTMISYDGFRDELSMRQWIHNFIPSNILEMNDRKLHLLLKSEPFVLVLFHAPWCRPCRLFHMDYIAVSNKLSAVKFSSVNCEIHSGVCASYKISAYPSVLLYVSGKFYRQIATVNSDQFEKDVLLALRASNTGHGTVTYLGHDEL